MKHSSLFAALLLFLSACRPDAKVDETKTEAPKDILLEALPNGEGSLFIIGGGSRPPYLVDALIDCMKDPDGLVLILPMASSEPDSAVWYARKQFEAAGLSNIRSLHLRADDAVGGPSDSLLLASMIYLCGGDQARFMASVPHPAVRQKFKQAYEGGCVIAGTSAGAAVMSKVMITGDQKQEPEYESTYRRLRSENGIYSEGLGLLDKVIIDQHFVERSRYNRAITALHDHPGMPLVGISESTAWIVRENSYEVCGESQVLVFTSEGLQANEQTALHGEVQLRILPARQQKTNEINESE